MTAVHHHLGMIALLLSCAAGQTTAGAARVENVTTSRVGVDLRIEITLSAPVKPAVETAEHPNRILLDFPETTCTAETRNVFVNANGVRRVRTGQHSTTPLITRVVLDLDQVHPYVVTAEGNRVILTVPPITKSRSHGAPVAATSGDHNRSCSASVRKPPRQFSISPLTIRYRRPRRSRPDLLSSLLPTSRRSPPPLLQRNRWPSRRARKRLLPWLLRPYRPRLQSPAP